MLVPLGHHLQSSHDFGGGPLVEDGRIGLEEVLDPLLGEEGQSAPLAGFHVPIVVEDSQFLPVGPLFVLQHELPKILAPFKQIFLVNAEQAAASGLHRPQCFRIDFDCLGELLDAVVPVDFSFRQLRHLQSIREDYF